MGWIVTLLWMLWPKSLKLMFNYWCVPTWHYYRIIPELLSLAPKNTISCNFSSFACWNKRQTHKSPISVHFLRSGRSQLSPLTATINIHFFGIIIFTLEFDGKTINNCWKWLIYELRFVDKTFRFYKRNMRDVSCKYMRAIPVKDFTPIT